MARVTISDVAARAGVSKSTVSHALSGKRPISEKTRIRILRAIEELGYRPDPVARNLAAGARHRGIGFVFPLLVPEIAGLEVRFIAAASAVINAADYAFVLLTHLDDDTQHIEQFANSGLAEGFILMQVQWRDSRVDFLRKQGIPFVLVGRCEDNMGLNYVDSDVWWGINQCMQHLVGLGHKHIAYLHQDAQDFGFVIRALDCYRSACEAHDMTPILQPCELSTASGRAALTKVFDNYPETSAIIVWNDSAAWGVLEEAEDRGLRVPEDISLVYFNEASVSRLSSRQPTFIDIRPEVIASTAAQMMVDILNDKTPAKSQVLVSPNFVVGGNTGPKANV